jgi:DNA-binding PadR family transcriptional regulator
VRLTVATVAVANALLSPQEPRPWLRDISRRTGLKSGTVHPILDRMLDKGWVTARREKTKEGSRRYYQVTELGSDELGKLVARAQQDPRFTHLFRDER